jgi:ubiquinone/menaquinone biosynthesis C-methylase UbiE
LRVRCDIVTACKLKPGLIVADIGAGTDFFTRLFAREVSPGGKVFAVDVALKLIEHIDRTCKEQGLKNVVGIVCRQNSAALPANSIDLAFISLGRSQPVAGSTAGDEESGEKRVRT